MAVIAEGGTVTVHLWIWGAFLAFILAMLAVDLLVFHRRPHEVSTREALAWSAVWVTLGIAFAGVVWAWQGGEAAGQYLAGYLIEKSLSVDNVFVFALLLSYFAVPAKHQHRVLFWGVLGALVLRAVFIAGGAALLDAFHWMIYVFGGFLVITGIRMAVQRENAARPERNRTFRLMRRAVPMTDGYRGGRFFVREAGRLLATPLLAVLVVVDVTDVVFAVDSIPAIFAVTRDTFLVFTSNAFAILGLRALYFVLADAMERFSYLKLGLSIILAFVGVKMAVSDLVHVPIPLSLGAIAGVLGAAIAASLLRPPTRRNQAGTLSTPGPARE
jgi:tellurite resistance protein TerC